jgi:hypothetical protein
MGAVELADFLQNQLQTEIEQTIVYIYPTPKSLADFLFSQYASNKIVPRTEAEASGTREDIEVPGW